jgi:ATP-dependent Clp protease adaptor protein ClpS
MTSIDAPPSPPETIVRPSTKTRQKTKRQPPYAVILHNDDVNSFEFVIQVLQKVFHYDVQKAVSLMLQAHETGRSIVWTGSLEVAELKADQIRSCGPDPLMLHNGAAPLGVSIEPLPE